MKAVTLFATVVLALGLSAFAGTGRADDAAPRKPLNDIPMMHEEALAAGIDHIYGGPWEFFVGGGGAAFDCNGDRMPDVFLAGGKNPSTLYINHSKPGGALKFTEAPMGIDPKDLTNVLGAYALDIDNDGHRDLVLLRLGENVILKGGPSCSFTKVNKAFAFDGGRAWTTSFAATWEQGQTFPTMAFGNYVDRSAPGSPWGTCDDNILARPSPGKEPDYSEPQRLTPGYCALSVLFTDWNRSGTPSLRIANDRQYYRGGEEQLWKVDPGQPAKLYTRADGWRHLSIWGMGIAEGDIDGDGIPEYAITSMGDTKLQKLDDEDEEGRPIYDDIAWDKGATAHRPYTGGDLKPSTGWHDEFADFNNDGLLDLYIAKGNVEQMPDFASNDPDNLLLGQWDGGFAEAGDQAGIALPTKGRGALVDDFNADGMLDLLVINREQKASLFRNLGAVTPSGPQPMGNFVEIELQQPKINLNAVGALIYVKCGTKTFVRTVEVGGGHASGHSGFVHVGVGTAERAEIRVKWPDGDWSPPYRVFANNFVIIGRGAPAAKYWYPADVEEQTSDAAPADSWKAAAKP